MSCLGANPEDRFSHDEAHIFQIFPSGRLLEVGVFQKIVEKMAIVHLKNAG